MQEGSSDFQRAGHPPQKVSSDSPDLVLHTGLLDDPRRVLQGDDSIYNLGLIALDGQDTWTLREHARYWQAGLVAWPTAGRPSVDRLSLAAAFLESLGVSDPVELAACLGVQVGTIRRRASDGRRERPNLERGRRLLRDRGHRPECSDTSIGLTLQQLARPGLPPDPWDRRLPRVIRLDDELAVFETRLYDGERAFINPLLHGLTGRSPGTGGALYADLVSRHLAGWNERQRSGPQTVRSLNPPR